MAAILIGLLVLGVVVALLARFAAVVMGRAVGSTVNERHRAAEHIIETGTPPRAWLERTRRRSGAGHPGFDAKEQEAVRQQLLRRLDELARYFALAPVFENEEARRLLLEELQKARAAWSTAPLEDLVHQQ